MIISVLGEQLLSVLIFGLESEVFGSWETGCVAFGPVGWLVLVVAKILDSVAKGGGLCDVGHRVYESDDAFVLRDLNGLQRRDSRSRKTTYIRGFLLSIQIP